MEQSIAAFFPIILLSIPFAIGNYYLAKALRQSTTGITSSGVSVSFSSVMAGFPFECHPRGLQRWGL